MLEIVAAVLSIIVLLITMAVYGGRNKSRYPPPQNQNELKDDPVEAEVLRELKNELNHTEKPDRIAYNRPHLLSEKYKDLSKLQRFEEPKHSPMDEISDAAKSIISGAGDFGQYLKILMHSRKNGRH